MAQKKKASQTSEPSTVTRIKATDTKPAAINETPKKKIAKKAETTGEKQKKAKKPSAKGIARPFTATGGYFVGAWQELRQVRWPNRRATWSMTLAVLIYTAFFATLVLLLDLLFKYLFDLILG